MESVCEKGPEETGKQGGWKHCLWLLKLILRLCFAGRVRTAVRGRRESGGSDAPARCGRNSPCVQQQGQRPHGVCGQSPKGACEQPSPAALKGALAHIHSVRPSVRTATWTPGHGNLQLQWGQANNRARCWRRNVGRVDIWTQSRGKGEEFLLKTCHTNSSTVKAKSHAMKKSCSFLTFVTVLAAIDPTKWIHIAH